MNSDRDKSRQKPISSLVQNLVRTRIPTREGEFILYYYANSLEKKEHLALVKGDVQGAIDVPVRLHSECITGDVFGSLRCDCGDQLERALRLIGKSECGVLLYLRQEGRGIGLMKKMQAYNLQDEGLDTVEANLRLGHREDERDYLLAAAILQDLKITSIRLITNNPKKINELRTHGIEVTDRIPIEVPYNSQNEGYLRAKANKMQHWLGLKSRQDSVSKFVFLDPLLKKLSNHDENESVGVFITKSYMQGLAGSNLDENILENNLSPSVIDYLNGITEYLTGTHDACLIDVGWLAGRKVQGSYDRVNRLLIWDELLVFPEWTSSKPDVSTVILCSQESFSGRKELFREYGVEIIPLTKDAQGNWQLDELCKWLYESRIHSLFVEGGGSLLQQITDAGRVNYYVITMIPGVIGGDQSNTKFTHPGSPNIKGISHCHYHAFDEGIILHGSTD